MLYDIETADKRVSKYLSDGTTTGVRIANQISKNLDGLKFEAGKAYTIKIVVGLESVKVTAEVKDWGDEAQTVDVDMPHNPGEGSGSGGEGGDTPSGVGLNPDLQDEPTVNNGWSRSER